MRLKMARCGVVIAGFVMLMGARAGAADTGTHLGVATCAGNTCHGSVKPFADTSIPQNEYFVWQRKDFHAHAFETLQSQRSAGIARKMGLSDASTARECLSCHSDNAPAAQRGPRFVVADGIGCEACHGGSGHWVATHTRGYKTLDERIADGLYPTWDANERARLCVSCHVGDDAHPMSHAIMAAGHPPILFELNTYTTIEPPHWRIDTAYVGRKGAQDPARDWVAGQIAAARVELRNLAGPRLMRTGVFPEPAFYDCDACHHSMKAGRVSTARDAGMPVGNIPFADAQIVMVGLWLDVVDPASANAWRTQLHKLYMAGAENPQALRAQALVMAAQLDKELLPKSAADLASPQVHRLLGRIVANARRTYTGDFAHAEQTAMASAVLLTALSDRGAAQVTPELRAAVDGLYAQVKDRDKFSVSAYSAALEKLQKVLGAVATG
jgi:hypothetical protein